LPAAPAPAQPQSDIFNHHFLVPPTTPIPAEEHRPPPARQIPPGWFIGSGIVLALGSVWLLIRSVRVWRAFNLFDRQYRFSQPQDVATRLGAERNGGHMAAIRFGEPPGT
jgi:hypothetical protein